MLQLTLRVAEGAFGFVANLGLFEALQRFGVVAIGICQNHGAKEEDQVGAHVLFGATPQQVAEKRNGTEAIAGAILGRLLEAAEDNDFAALHGDE